MKKKPRSNKQDQPDQPDLFESTRSRLRRPLMLPGPFAKEADDWKLDRAKQDAAHGMIRKWAALEAGGHLNKKETAVDASFLFEIFGEGLGYTLATKNPQRYHLERNFTVPHCGTADGALGSFGPESESKLVAVIELKGARTDLDTERSKGRTAVQQCWDYLNALPECPWGIVSNFVSIRLYHRDKTPSAYEEFLLQDMMDDIKTFRQFFYLFERDGLLTSPFRQPPRALALLGRSDKQRLAVGERLYAIYSDRRLGLIRHLRERHGRSPDESIRIAQKLLDRILFIAFCEQRGLLPGGSLGKAYETLPPFSKVANPRWRNFLDLFQAIDKGHASLDLMHGYNGGLFRHDPAIDDLQLDDDWTDFFKDISKYDFQNEVNVDVLGHIFEKSIDDLEEIRMRGLFEQIDIDRTPDAPAKSAERKRSGTFYTRPEITRFMVGETLKAWIEDRRDSIRHELGMGPVEPISDAPTPALAAYWRRCWDDLRAVTICDPACGSGAFLIQAYEVLEQEYVRVADLLRFHEGHEADSLLDSISELILQGNLHGVDLSEQAVEITQLALWLRSARRGRTLADLSHNIVWGNSLVDDPAVHPRAVDWRAAFPEVFDRGGFDVVVGNPPYVRQEWIAPYKPYLKSAFQTFHGTADLYVYFYELGMRLLRPGGRLAYVVTNKWLKAAYGEPLRRYFAEHAWVESVVDFGHAKELFPDADVFPSILVARKPTEAPAPAATRVCTIPRGRLDLGRLNAQIKDGGFDIERARLGGDAWSLEPQAVEELLAKLRSRGMPLAEFAGVKPLYGVKTGLNEAFLIDTPTRDALVAADPSCAEVIRPYLRGQDIKRWSPEWAGLWMIALKSSQDHSWPWSTAVEPALAEEMFRATYPSLHARLRPIQGALAARQDKGKNWWELRSCAYWAEFGRTKIFYQEIQYHPSFAIDPAGRYGNNKTFFLPTDDLYLLCVLNSPIAWWHNWRFLPHMKDEALSPVGFLMETMPVASPADDLRSRMGTLAGTLIEIKATLERTSLEILDWLLVEHDIAEPSTKLQSPIALDTDAFIAEVKKLQGKKPLSAAGIRSLREEHERTIVPAQARAREAIELERRVSDLVNEAYGLTPEEVRLMWATAPPRMPIPAPPSS